VNLLDLEKAKWYINRLYAMPMEEVKCRLKEWFQVERERLWLGRHSDSSFHSLENVDDVFRRFKRDRDVSFFFTWSDRSRTKDIYSSSFLTERGVSLETAERLLHWEITLFDRCFDLGETMNWSQDPLTGRDWPLSFYADVDIRNGQTVGGVKWVWELNRHHHLVTLGKAYFLSGEEQYAQEVCTHLKIWIERNPPRIGVNWTSPLELAIRLINWVWALAFIRQSTALTPETFGVVLQSVARQAQHISRHLSAYSSANNHLIGEAAGLAVVGLFFPGLPQADQWRNTGLDILEREIEKQIYPDGVPAEQAIHYLAFVLDFNLLVWRLVELTGYAVPKIWYERLEVACEFICHIMDENGHAPAIGDSDDAWVVRLDDRPEANNYCSILATAAVLLERPDFKAKAGRWDEKSHWLLGTPGQETFESLSLDAPKCNSQAFEEGGYCVMRAPGRVITFDCGPLGYLSIAAHGHADALSLTVSVDGQPILIDPGTYAYQEGGERRDYFRSSAAHNTIVVDGEDQSEMLGTFLWGRKAEAHLLHWETTENYDLAIAEHDGYDKLLGVIHQRTVLFHKPDWLIIADRLKGHGEHSFEQLWHVPAECEVTIEQDPLDQKYVSLRVGYKQLIMIPLEMPSAVHPRIQTGEEQPMQGWVSSKYGHVEPGPVVNFSGESQLPIQLVTALRLVSLPDSIVFSDLKGEAMEIWKSFVEGVLSEL
jgi:hypothetical protein